MQHEQMPVNSVIKDNSTSSRSLSVVVPCFNEEEVIEVSHQRLTDVLQQIPLLDYELIYVDDGSTDRTADQLEQLQRGDPRVRVIGLSRNFGHQIAVTAGINEASGEGIVLIDADLQDPPEVIPRLVEQWRNGYEVAYGKRSDRAGETFIKRWTAAVFYRVINRLSDIPIPLDTGDFRLIDRKVIEVMRQMPERDRFVRGMVSWAGFRQVAVPYRRKPRLAGSSKYPLFKSLKLATDGMLSFSLAPLRLATGIGFVAALLALFGICYALITRLFTNVWVPGWTALFIAVLFLGGVQLISLGIIGEYVGRTYGETKHRPLYVVRKRYGFTDEVTKPITKQKAL